MLQKLLKHKKMVLIACLVIGFFVAYYFLVYKKGSGMGAIDADDDAAVQQMIATFQGSQFADSIPYLMGEYTAKYAKGGINQPQPSEGWYLMNNKVTASGAFLKTVWTGWVGAYCDKADKGNEMRPMPGRTMDEAKAAQAVAVRLQVIWQDYRQRQAGK